LARQNNGVAAVDVPEHSPLSRGPGEAKDTADHLQGGTRRPTMRYLLAWILGVPFSIIVIWFLVGHAACGH